MADKLGRDYISNKLKNTAAITAIVSTNIFYGTLVPKRIKVKTTINFYYNSLFDGALDYGQRGFSIDCRAATEVASQALAFEVFEAFNRAAGACSGRTYHSRATILTTIPKINDEDVYNTPVSINLQWR